jgi:hypothetical protein
MPLQFYLNTVQSYLSQEARFPFSPAATIKVLFTRMAMQFECMQPIYTTYILRTLIDCTFLTEDRPRK